MLATATTTAEVSTWQGMLKKGWLDDASYSATGFTLPSVNTMLAGLLLHWHALSSAVALVSNHDIWTLSRIYSDALLLNPAKPFTAWHFLFICFFPVQSRQEAYHDTTCSTENTFWMWHLVMVYSHHADRCFEVWSSSSFGLFSHTVKFSLRLCCQSIHMQYSSLLFY